MNKKNIFIKQFLVLFCGLFVATRIMAQTPDVTISGNLTGTSNTQYPARDGVRILPGASFKADATHSFKGWIDQNTVVPLTQFGWSVVTNIDERTINTQLPVGATTGSIDVSGIGSAVYNIPVILPPGTAGMQPNLSISYNSGIVNGIMGAGWDISGISSISRVRKNFYMDGSYGGVNFNSSDAFALDGNRLISVGTNEYRTEMETFSKITVTSSDANGPLAFKVETKDGLIIEYGSVDNSRYKHSSDNAKILSWYVSKVSDQHGNYYTYTYVNKRAEGEFRISRIDYTFNDNAGIVGENAIVFAYISKPDYQVTNTYKYGSFVSDKVLLQEIRVFNNEAVAHKYKFNYTNEDTYPHLIEIQEFGSDGATYNSTVLNYNTPKTSYEITEGFLYPNANSVFYSDFDGDGIDERSSIDVEPVYNTPNCNIYVNIPNKNAPSPNTYTKHLISNIPMALYDQYDYNFFESNNKYKLKGLSHNNDINGDGFNDLLVKEKDGNNTTFKPITVSPIVSQGTTTYSITNRTPFTITDLLGDGVVMDFNKDGLSDFIYVTLIDSSFAGTYWKKNCSIEIRRSSINNPFSEGNQIGTYEFAGCILNLNLTPLDYNGDGLMDFIIGNSIYVNTGYGFTPIVISACTQDDSGFKEITPVDINGDGYSDFYAESINGTKKFYASTGETGTFIASNASFLFQEGNDVLHRFGDFNGDGKTDFLYNINITQPSESCSSRGHIRILFNKNFSNGEAITSSNINNGAYYNTMTDYYCETMGLKYVQDILFMNIKNTDIPELYFKYNGDYVEGFALQVSNTLKEISNGLGHRTKINYTGSGENYAPSEYPVVSCAIPMPTVKSIETSDGVGGMQTTSFSFSDPKIHFQGNGFLGYMKIVKTSDKVINEGLTTRVNEISKYKYSIIGDQSYVYYYAYPDSKEVIYDFVNSNNEIISKPISKSEYQSAIYNFGYRRYFPYLSQTTNHEYLWSEYTDPEASSTEIVSVNQFIYSPTDIVNGNLTSVVTTKGNSTTTVEYSNYGAYGSPIPNKFTDKTTTLHVTDSDDQTGTEHYDYLSNGLLYYSLRTPGIGDPNVAGSPTQTVETTYEYYSECGLPKEVTVLDNSTGTSMTSSMEYDAKYRFVVKQTNPLGHVAESTYDPIYGNVLTSKDINGLITTYQYDGFGRSMATTLPDGNTITKEMYFAVHPQQPPYNTGITPDLNSMVYYVLTKTPGTSDYLEGYDVFGRLVRTQKCFGYGSLTDIGTNYYNSIGQLVQKRANNPNGGRIVAEFEFDPFFRPLNTKEFTSTVVTDTRYLEHDNLTPTNNVVGYSYNGLTATVVNNGKSTTKKLSNTGLLEEVTDNIGGVITYKYNSANQVTAITSVGSTTTIEYDKYGRQKTITEPNTGVTTYNYNGLSQITSQTDPKGNLYAFTYDKLGRVLTKSETASGTSTPVVTNYKYDTEANGKGAIASITGGANGFSTSYKYDALSRNYKVIETNSGKVFTTTNEYDGLGRVKKVIYPSKDNVDGGFYVNYIYDVTFGHLIKITDTNNKTIWELQSRNVNGSCKEVKLGLDGKIIKTTTFATNGTPYESKMNYTGANPWENKWKYVFNASTLNLDSRNNILTVNGSITRDLTETFEYDNLDRLWKTYKNSGQGAVLTQEMNYSGNGNIENKTDAGTYQYDAGPHVASGIQNSPTPLTLQDITYTPFNKMKTVIIDDQASLTMYKHSLTYGFDNERRISVDQSSPDPIHFADIRTKYYSRNYELIIQGTTKKELHYVTAPDGLAAIYEIKDGVGTMYYTQTDYQGSLMMVVKEDGTRVNDLSYDAWGNRRDPNSWKLKTSIDLVKELNLAKLITDRGYTLHEHLDAYGLINMNGRAYDQRLAQFLSPDPFVQAPENTQSYNRYAYCMNNPFKYTDPSGYLASNSVSMYNLNDLIENGSGVSYYIDDVKVTGDVYHAYSGAGTVEYYGNVGFSSSSSGYCLLNFKYYQDISTITVQYSYSNYNSKGDDESFLTGGNVLPATEVPIDRKFFYGSYTINRNFGPYSNQSGQESSGNGFFHNITKYAVGVISPVAKGYSIGMESEAISGGEVQPIGVVLVLQGKSAGTVFTYSECTFGAGWIGVDGTINFSEYYYFGNIDNFSYGDFKGMANNYMVSIDVGASLGISISISQDESGGFLVGRTMSVGVGIGPTLVSGMGGVSYTKIHKVW